MKDDSGKIYDSDQHLVECIRKGDTQAFKSLFFSYYYDLCGFAVQITGSEEQAKDIVQELFYKLWKGRKRWSVNSSLRAYLFQSVRNEALNQAGRERRRRSVREQLAAEEDRGAAGLENRRDTNNHHNRERLLLQIWSLVGDLPRRRRTVFVLHRKHGLSYREIGEVLGISRKTVENHMGLALSDIRDQIEIKPD